MDIVLDQNSGMYGKQIRCRQGPCQSPRDFWKCHHQLEERLQTVLYLKHLREIAEFYNVSESYLLGKTNKKPSAGAG